MLITPGNKKIKILLLGLSYKKNVDDDRESPTYEFMKIFRRKKIQYDYHDPYFDRTRKGRNTNENKKSKSNYNLLRYIFW